MNTDQYFLINRPCLNQGSCERNLNKLLCTFFLIYRIFFKTHRSRFNPSFSYYFDFYLYMNFRNKLSIVFKQSLFFKKSEALPK